MLKKIYAVKKQEGATAIEYGLIAGLIAIAIVAVLVTLGPKLSSTFQNVQDKLPGASTSGS